MKKYLMLLLFLNSYDSSAVYINHQGSGEVLLVPYYSVNNGLNTMVSVTNPTGTNKAVSINFREGLNGHGVLSYNVYLGPYDTWTFALVPETSTVNGFIGQNSVVHISNDQSCVPFLPKSAYEFLPYGFLDGPQDMSRAREGYIEIIEMGEFQGDFVDAANQDFFGSPNDCNAFVEAWDHGGVWDVESGGDVSLEGINYSIPVVALDNFFAEDQIAHVAPGYSTLSLDAAAPEAIVFANDKAYQLTFESGIDAVSAVLMSYEVIGNYVLDTIVSGKTEVVFTQPTRRFYVGFQGEDASPPYNLSQDRLVCPTVEDFGELSQYGGVRVDWSVYDREAQVESMSIVDPPPPRLYSALCDSVNVYQFLLPDSFIENHEVAAITGSNNFQSITSPYGATENGFFKLGFLDTRPLVGFNTNDNQSIELMGIPVLGITLKKFTNSGALEGLLAQYGGSERLAAKVRLSEVE